MDCMLFDYPKQAVKNDCYTAEPVPGFGICVYVVGIGNPFSCQCYHASNDGDRYEDYVRHVLAMAGGRTSLGEEREVRRFYQYFTAPDILTLRCLIEEAAAHWSTANGRSISEPNEA